MGDLADRMHARIGAAGAMDRDALAAEGGDRLGQHALHGRSALLDLPAGERRAVVFDDQLVARHGSTEPTGSAAPRKNSSGRMGCRPARCSSTMRTAPSRHATVRRSSSTVPGAPPPSPYVVRSTLTRSPPASANHAPGN